MANAYEVRITGYVVEIEAENGWTLTATTRYGKYLGVEDYRWLATERLSGKRRVGPYANRAARAPTPDEINMLRREVRKHLVAIDSGEVSV